MRVSFDNKKNIQRSFVSSVIFLFCISQTTFYSGTFCSESFFCAEELCLCSGETGRNFVNIMKPLWGHVVNACVFLRTRYVCVQCKISDSSVTWYSLSFTAGWAGEKDSFCIGKFVISQKKHFGIGENSKRLNTSVLMRMYCSVFKRERI